MAEGVDFKAKNARSGAAQLHIRAKQLGLKVRCKTDGDCTIVQAYRADGQSIESTPPVANRPTGQAHPAKSESTN